MGRHGGIESAAAVATSTSAKRNLSLVIVFFCVAMVALFCTLLASADTLVQWKSALGKMLVPLTVGSANTTISAVQTPLSAVAQVASSPAGAISKPAAVPAPAPAPAPAPVVAASTPVETKPQPEKAAENIVEPLPKTVEERCQLTRGDWCRKYDKEPEVQFNKAKHGSKPCANNCNNDIGVCNYDIGICDCPAGWAGNDCMTPFKRPCTNGWRGGGQTPRSHTGPDGRDLNWLVPGWTASRCGGICDNDLGFCYCDGKYKHIPAPPGSPYGARAVQPGRHLGDHCKPKTNKDGKQTGWGNVEYDKLYGPAGWCEADIPAFHCSCMLDGWDGINCDQPYEATCPNSCSGYGRCVMGFCKCHEGHYGTDCAHVKEGHKQTPGDQAGHRPWLNTYMRLAPAAQDPLPATRRKRPFIYVYNLPAAYNTRMWQYRVNRGACVWRQQNQADNSTRFNFFTYAIEGYLHETLLQSEHRTLDPEEADFFYVPVYTGCFMHPVFGWADAPWWGAPNGLRVMHAANMHLEVQRWLSTTYPYWNRSGGADHLWLTPHDEGACWMPKIIYDKAIMLTHWGRLDPNHQSNTAYTGDNYSQPIVHHEYQPVDWIESIKGHPCFDPAKDVVIPAFKEPNHARLSPVVGAAPRIREHLLYFRGDVGKMRQPWYSRGVRQKLHKLVQEQGWKQKHKIIIGGYADAPGDYSEFLAKSKFCLVAPGDGWSPRLEDSLLHGCVPLIIMDNVSQVWENQLEFEKFSVRIKESDVERTAELLLAISKERLNELQRNVMKVAHRYLYATGPFLKPVVSGVLDGNRHDQPRDRDMKSNIHPRREFPFQDDAFHTLIQYLHSRMGAWKKTGRRARS